MHIPNDLLKSFTYVVDYDGFSKAGERLGKSQPAMSLQMKRLELIIGRPLLYRTSRRLRLTETGQMVLQYARRILALHDELVNALSQSSLSGTVRLGIPNEFAVSYLPQILAGFSKRYPEVSLEVVSELSKHLLERQQEQQLDLVIALSIDQHKQKRLIGQAVWSEELVWVQSQDSMVIEADCVSIVAAPEGCVYRDRMAKTLDASSANWNIVYTGTSYGGIRAAVMAGLGVTALARSTVPDGLRIAPNSIQLPKLESASVSLHFLSKKPSQIVSRLSEFIIDSVAATKLM